MSSCCDVSWKVLTSPVECGILIMYFIGSGCTFIKGLASFRTAWGIQFVPCVLLLIGLPFLPRSLRWLAKMDRTSEAIEVHAKIQANGDVNDPLVVAEWEDINEVLTAERAAGPGWSKFFKNGMWKRTLAGFTVQMWQQNSGDNVMTYVSLCLNTRPATHTELRCLVRRLYLRHGRAHRQHQPHRLWRAICALYRIHNNNVLLHR